MPDIIWIFSASSNTQAQRQFWAAVDVAVPDVMVVVADRTYFEGGDEDFDQLPLDLTPNDCWRCDAAPAATDVGLCSWCHRTLTSGTRGPDAELMVFDEVAEFCRDHLGVEMQPWQFEFWLHLE